MKEIKFRQTLLGIAIGDAFGAGVEFQDRDWIRRNVDFTEFVNVRNKIKVPSDKIELFTKNYREWDYTDDTEMTIGLIKALLSGQEFTQELLILKWREEYERGITEKGYGRNGHGSMAWYFSGDKSIDEIRKFQKERKNPGNAPAMRSVPLGFVKEELINEYGKINANSTHPNIHAILSSQCIARAVEFLIIKNGLPKDVINYCCKKVNLNEEYYTYLQEVNKLPNYNQLSALDFMTLCGDQPIQEPYFLAGINGVPSDSKYTTGSVLYILKNSDDAFDALKKSIYLGGDVDSIASIATGVFAGISGLESIPSYMQENVEGVNYIERLAKEFDEKFLNSI